MQLVLAERGRGVVEVQNGGGRLDDVPAALRAAEAVVSGQTEVLVAAAAIGELKHLTRNHGLLLRHTAGWTLGQPGISNSWKQNPHKLGTEVAKSQFLKGPLEVWSQKLLSS